MMNSRAKGFTLVELLVVTLIGAIVLGAVYKTLTIQERTNRHQLAIVQTEQNVRTAMAVLTSDLREISSTGGDIVVADSLSIRYRALRKAGIICEKDITGNWIHVAVMGQPFESGDSILVFLDGLNKASAQDDRWVATTVAGSNAGTCTGNPIGNIGRIIVPAGAAILSDTGGLVRSFRQIGYRIVNTGSSGSLFRMEGSDSVAIVEGLSSIDNQGLRFRYFRANGSQFTPSSAAQRDSIMRIEVKVRAAAPGGTTGTGREYSDSLVGQVFLRGNVKRS